MHIFSAFIAWYYLMTARRFLTTFLHTQAVRDEEAIGHGPPGLIIAAMPLKDAPTLEAFSQIKPRA